MKFRTYKNTDLKVSEVGFGLWTISTGWWGNFTEGEAIALATDAALKRLKTDRIDLLQLHNIRMEQVHDDSVWKALEKLKASGKVRYYGIALGPAIGWLYEGVNCIRERDITSVQHIYNLLEQHPGRAMHEAAANAGKDTMFLI